MPKSASPQSMTPQATELGTAGLPSGIALDTHVHLYPGADFGCALSAGRANLHAAAQRAGLNSAVIGLLLTETHADDAFSALASGTHPVPGWTFEKAPADPAALWARQDHGEAAVLLAAGSQVITSEKIEVLALATAARFADGQPLEVLLDILRSREIPAVLPWGLGKWIGTRGAKIACLLEEGVPQGLLFGDNAGRPGLWRTPELFRRPVARNIAVLPGTDPLPISDAESGIGRYGCFLPGTLDPDRPVEDLRARLFTLEAPPQMIGQRRTTVAVIAEQIALRTRRGRRSGAPVSERRAL